MLFHHGVHVRPHEKFAGKEFSLWARKCWVSDAWFIKKSCRVTQKKLCKYVIVKETVKSEIMVERDVPGVIENPVALSKCV